MEGNSNWKPNEQSIVNNANDWRSQHEPNLRSNVVSNVVKGLQGILTDHNINKLKDFALKIEEEAYGIATDKGDYNRRISERLLKMERETIDFHYGSSVNETTNYTLEPAVAAAQALNQGQLVPASVPYTQAPTSQQWLQPGFQRNPNVHASYLPQNTTYMFQHQVNQQRLNETIRIRNLQQTQQQFPYIQHPFPRFRAVSSSPTSGRINPQISALEVCPSYQQKKAKLIQLKQEMEELEKDINQDETYQKIQVLKKMCLPFLSTYLQINVDKLREIDSKQKGKHKEIESLKDTKTKLEQVIEFLNVDRSRVSEMHIKNLAKFGERLLKWGRSKTEQPLNPMQQQQRQFPPLVLQKRREVNSKDENNTMVTSGNVVLPSLKQNQQVVQSDMFQQRQHLQQPEANQQLQKLNYVRMRQGINIEAGLLQLDLSSSHLQLPTPLNQMPTSHETTEMNYVRMRQGINIEAGLLQQHLSSSQRQLPTPLASQAQLVDQEIPPAVLVNQTGTPTQPAGTPVSEESRACLPEDLTETLKRSLTTHDEVQNQSKRTKRLNTSQTDLESEGDSTASSWL